MELFAAASDAIFDIDPNAANLFQNLTSHMAERISLNVPVDFAFVFQRYDSNTMLTAGVRFPLSELLDRETSGGPRGKPTLPPSVSADAPSILPVLGHCAQSLPESPSRDTGRTDDSTDPVSPGRAMQGCSLHTPRLAIRLAREASTRPAHSSAEANPSDEEGDE